jgi:hypothetical protein
MLRLLVVAVVRLGDEYAKFFNYSSRTLASFPPSRFKTTFFQA